MDNFFLRGQKQGAFRIDLNISFLTTAFTSIIYGLINAERQGRIVKVGMEDSFEDFFLSGSAQDQFNVVDNGGNNE